MPHFNTVIRKERVKEGEERVMGGVFQWSRHSSHNIYECTKLAVL